MTRPGLPVLAVALLLSACSGDTPAPGATPATSSAPVPRPPTPSDSACPRDGTWKACALEDRINKAGIGIRVLDTITVPFLPVPGVRYKIGKTATMAAFFLPDSATGAKATEGLDRLHLTPRGDTLGAWPAAPFEAIRSANLIAVLFGVNSTQAERVRLAITAGAPQPFTEQPQPLPPAQAR